MFELMVETDFAAAHSLREYHGKCENVHGHNWKVQIVLSAERLDGVGMVLDFKDIKGIAREILEAFDHKNLNELAYFRKDNPTTENISRVLYAEFSKKLPKEVTLRKVSVWESDRCGASYFE